LQNYSNVGGVKTASLDALLRDLEKKGYLTDARVEDAFMCVPLEHFVPKRYKSYIYQDLPIPFFEKGNIVKTISAPHVIVQLLQALELKSGMKILKLGAKSGYLASLLAEIIGGKGKVTIIEGNTEIYETTRANLTKVKYKNIEIYNQNPLIGLADESPYDRILITGQIEKVPKELVYQLKDDGFILAPVGNIDTQELTIYSRLGLDYQETKIGPVVFGPLIFPNPENKNKLLHEGDPLHHKFNLERNLKAYKRVLEHAWSDGGISVEEAAMLEKLRESLNITPEQHFFIEKEVRDKTIEDIESSSTVLLEAVRQAMISGDKNKTAILLQKIIELKEESFECELCKTFAYSILGRVEPAMEHIDKAILQRTPDKSILGSLRMIMGILVVRLEEMEGKKDAGGLEKFQLYERKLQFYANLVLSIDPTDKDAANVRKMLKRP